MYLILRRDHEGVTITAVDGSGVGARTRQVGDLPREVARLEVQRPRWVWDDTTRWYPELLAAGVRVERCVDLRLCHVILRNSSLTSSSSLATGSATAWDEPTRETPVHDEVLFDLGTDLDELDPLAEFRLQRAAVAATDEPARLNLLLSAESAGALIATEMRWAGLPWNAGLHDALLTRSLGPRPIGTERPERMRAAYDRVLEALDVPELSIDSPPELLKALERAGIPATSTRSWELTKIDHPAIPPLLEYKKLARLLSANGWNWLETNVANGRFRPDYVPGGVVTGRWASKGGGGALQLPKQIRGAVVADPGWKLVVADASQLEPRVLAALAADRGMVEAGSSGDLYAGIVASGAVDTREHAKVAMLAAMYGATSGEAGRLLPRLARTYPRAIEFVENAARAGERGEVVTTLLGRSSPPGVSAGYDETADQSQVRNRARAWGRFTRNFVVQGTAAEWALCWMASLRARLHTLAGGVPLPEAAHLVFFVHDELVVHAPTGQTAGVEEAMHAAATDAGRLLFGALPVDFPLTVAVVDDYGQAK